VPSYSPSAVPSSAPSVVPSSAPSSFPSFTNETLNEKIVCVSVIDEAVGEPGMVTPDLLESNWTSFRANYPDRPFCLLHPTGGRPIDDLHIPSDFYPPYDNLTTWADVTRDHGNPELADDWFVICGLEGLRATGVTAVGLFVDNSGSMTEAHVQASIDKFLASLAPAGLVLKDAIYNGHENWILPHNMDYV